MARHRSDWRRHVVRRPDAPDTWEPPSPTAALGLFLATRALPEGPPRAFRDTDRLFEAFARGDLALDDAVRVQGRVTTAGRCLVGACLPPSVREPTRGVPWTRAYATEVLARITRELHVELAARAAEALERLGGFVAERSGLSVGLDDLAAPPERDAIIAEAFAGVAAAEAEGVALVSSVPEMRPLDYWVAAREQLRRVAQSRAPDDDPLAPFAAAADDPSLPARLRARVDLRPSRGGSIHDLPILHAPAQGLHPHEAAILAAEARREALAEARRDATVATLLHDLHAVLEDVRVVARDCGAPRSAAPRRDVLRCEAVGGVCGQCFGRDPDDATVPATGDPVGARAALAIARAARGLREQVFHICGMNSVREEVWRERGRATRAGTVRYVGLEVARVGGLSRLTLYEPRDDNARVCLGDGRLEVHRGPYLLEAFRVRRGSVLAAQDGATVDPGDLLFERHLAEIGALRASLPADVVATACWSEEPTDARVDSLTGLSRPAFTPGADDVTLALVDADGRPLVTHALHRTSAPRVASGDLVRRGDLLAFVLAEGEPWGGFPGADWLRGHLDARAPRPHDRALVAPCDARFEATERERLLLRTSGGHAVSLRLCRWKHVIVCNGDVVRAGDALTAGARCHHRLLRLWGEARLGAHLADEVEREASHQGVALDGAWVALAVRAMLAWRRVVRPGSTGLRRNAVVARDAFERVQRETAARGGEPARAVPVLRGFAAMARDQLRGGA